MYFSEIPLNDQVLDALDAMRFEERTPIQEQSIPIILEGRDLIAVAQTGTGKTRLMQAYVKTAEEKGYSQVLWLDGVERKYIEEVGAMNVMFKINGEIITPALTGSILPGITRKSCIEVLKNESDKVSERLLSIDELSEALENPVSNASFKPSFEWEVAYVFPLVVIAIIQLLLIFALLAESGLLPYGFVNFYMIIMEKKSLFY